MTDLDQELPKPSIKKGGITENQLKTHVSQHSNGIGSSLSSCNEDSNLSNSDKASLASQEDTKSRPIVHKNTARKKTYDSSYHLRISSPKPAKRLENG